MEATTCRQRYTTSGVGQMWLGSPNVTHKRSTISPGNPFISGSKGHKDQGHEAQNTIAGVGLCTLVSAGFF